MPIAIVDLKSESPYSQSKNIEIEKEPREQPNDYEKRTWRERIHYNKDGYVEIPPMQFIKALQAGAKYLNKKIEGNKNCTYTKNFLAGVLMQEGITLPLKKDDAIGDWHFVSSDGKPGGSSRVKKCFPRIDEWKGTVRFYVIDPIITEDIFREVLMVAGQLIGIGRFRPSKGGIYGRFGIEEFKWDKDNFI